MVVIICLKPIYYNMWRRDRKSMISNPGRITHVRMARGDADWFADRIKEKEITSAEYFSNLRKYCEKSISKPVNVTPYG